MFDAVKQLRSKITTITSTIWPTDKGHLSSHRTHAAIRKAFCSSNISAGEIPALHWRAIFGVVRQTVNAALIASKIVRSMILIYHPIPVPTSFPCLKADQVYLDARSNCVISQYDELFFLLLYPGNPKLAWTSFFNEWDNQKVFRAVAYPILWVWCSLTLDLRNELCSSSMPNTLSLWSRW